MRRSLISTVAALALAAAGAQAQGVTNFYGPFDLGTGQLSAGSAVITGTVTAGQAALAGGVSASYATLTGAVSAGSLDVTGTSTLSIVNAASAALTGALSANTASIGSLTATSLTMNAGLTLGTGVGPGAGGGTVSITTPNGSNIKINPQGTGTIDLSAATAVQNGLTVYGTGGSVSGAIPPLIFGEYGISGTVTGGAASESTLVAPSDTADASGAGGATMGILNVLDNAGGTGMKGGRDVLGATFTLYNPSSNVNDGAIYTAGVFNAYADSNDNGTSATPSGALTALNSVAQVNGGATYFSGVASYEADVGVFDPTGVMDKHGVMIVELANDAYHGSRDDIALVMSNQGNAVGWNTGISFGSVGAAFPVDAAGTLITGQAAGGAGFTVANGVDWHLGTFTGNSWNDGHVQITGGGQIVQAKISDPNTAPGAGKLQLTVEAGTTAGTCKIVARAGTSATPVTIVDNVGSGC